MESCSGPGQHEGLQTRESHATSPSQLERGSSPVIWIGKHADHFCPTDYDAKGSACDMSQKIARSAFEALDPPRTRGRLLPRF